jgi:F0F1-type ATP synthase assembly protein I
MRQLTGHMQAATLMYKFNFKKNRAWTENLQITMQIGLTMAGCIIFCFYIGYLIDGWLGTKGVFITIFTILGVMGGANVVYRQIMAVTTQKDEETDKGNH